MFNNNEDDSDIFGSDIYLDAELKPVLLNNGEVKIISGVDTVLQDIRLRLITLKGSLFYDVDFGSELPLLIQDDDIDETTILSEVTRSLEEDPRVEPYSVSVKILKLIDTISISIDFELINEDNIFNITIPKNTFLSEG